jgi:hypothetical protein
MLPHAMLTITPNTNINGTISTSFVYDNNGNQTSGLGRTIYYTSYKKPYSIQQGSSALTFTHDVDHQRYKQVAPEGTTLYFDAFGVHAETFGSAGTSYDYVSVGGAMLGVRVSSGSTVTTRYFHTDNLGSIAVITDDRGGEAHQYRSAAGPQTTPSPSRVNDCASSFAAAALKRATPLILTVSGRSLR